MSLSSEEAGSDSAPLLWRIQELRAARAAGLVGALVGCLPRTPRQNGRLGRPLLLLPEELRVLRGSEHITEELSGELGVLRGSERNTEELVVLRSSEHTTEELGVLRGSEHNTEELVVLRSSEHTTEELGVLWGSEHTTEGLGVLRSSEHTTEELGVLWGSEHTTEGLGVLRGSERNTEVLGVLRGSERNTEVLGVLRGSKRNTEEEEADKKEEQRLRFKEFLNRSHEEQSSLALDDRKSALTSSHSEAEAEGLSVRLKALDQSFVLPPSALAVQLSTCRAGLPHLQGSEPIRRHLQGSEPIRSHLQGSEPIRSQVRLQVFRDLRRRGFYLTSGGKFGADFLVYPGDPLRFHAHFMAVCVPLEDSVCLRDVLSWARLGSNVKKTLLLCSASPQGGVVYSSLQWSQMS